MAPNILQMKIDRITGDVYYELEGKSFFFTSHEAFMPCCTLWNGGVVDMFDALARELHLPLFYDPIADRLAVRIPTTFIDDLAEAEFYGILGYVFCTRMFAEMTVGVFQGMQVEDPDSTLLDACLWLCPRDRTGMLVRIVDDMIPHLIDEEEEESHLDVDTILSSSRYFREVPSAHWHLTNWRSDEVLAITTDNIGQVSAQIIPQQ